MPWTLLGIRSTIIDDLGVTPADLLYGQVLRLPGELISRDAKDPLVLDSSVAREIRDAIAQVRPTTTRQRTQKYFFVPKDLQECKFVFIREEIKKGSLNPSYQGPFEIISNSKKHFTVNRGNKHETISIDRLKPAFCASNQMITRSNAPVKPKVSFRM